MSVCLFTNYVYTTILKMTDDHDRYYAAVVHLLMSKRKFIISQIQLNCKVVSKFLMIVAMRYPIDVMPIAVAAMQSKNYTYVSRLVKLRVTNTDFVIAVAKLAVQYDQVRLVKYCLSKIDLSIHDELMKHVMLHSSRNVYTYFMQDLKKQYTNTFAYCRTEDMFMHVCNGNPNYDRMLEASIDDDPENYGCDGCTTGPLGEIHPGLIGLLITRATKPAVVAYCRHAYAIFDLNSCSDDCKCSCWKIDHNVADDCPCGCIAEDMADRETMEWVFDFIAQIYVAIGYKHFSHEFNRLFLKCAIIYKNRQLIHQLSAYITPEVFLRIVRVYPLDRTIHEYVIDEGELDTQKNFDSYVRSGNVEHVNLTWHNKLDLTKSMYHVTHSPPNDAMYKALIACITPEQAIKSIDKNTNVYFRNLVMMIGLFRLSAANLDPEVRARIQMIAY